MFGSPGKQNAATHGSAPIEVFPEPAAPTSDLLHIEPGFLP